MVLFYNVYIGTFKSQFLFHDNINLKWYAKTDFKPLVFDAPVILVLLDTYIIVDNGLLLFFLKFISRCNRVCAFLCIKSVRNRSYVSIWCRIRSIRKQRIHDYSSVFALAIYRKYITILKSLNCNIRVAATSIMYTFCFFIYTLESN